MSARSAITEIPSECSGDDEITIVRKAAVVEREQLFVRQTTKIGVVDARLLAIARGEVDPDVNCDLIVMDDPFGGLILVEEGEEEEPGFQGFIEIDDGWVLEAVDDDDDDDDDTPDDAVAPLPPVILVSATPRLCMEASELVALPLDHRSGFLLSHIDGKRTVEEVIDVSQFSANDTIEALGALIALGAIRID